MIGIGLNGKISVINSGPNFPHSLGLLYSALTFYLGWKHHCDEGIVMGLAPLEILMLNTREKIHRIL